MRKTITVIAIVLTALSGSCESESATSGTDIPKALLDTIAGHVSTAGLDGDFFTLTAPPECDDIYPQTRLLLTYLAGGPLPIRESAHGAVCILRDRSTILPASATIAVAVYGAANRSWEITLDVVDGAWHVTSADFTGS